MRKSYSIKNEEHLIFCISSKFRPDHNISYKDSAYYTEEIPELDKDERNGLLVRYAKFKDVSIERDDLNFFSNLLTGYPEQVIYAVDTISETSIFEAKKNSYLIQEYASDKAKLIIDNLKKDEVKLNFLYLLARFEFISFEFIFDLVEEEEYFPILSVFLLSSVCERFGTTGDYIRVNDVVRDFIIRSRFGITDAFNEKLTTHVNNFIKNYTDENRDISDYIFSIQEALIRGSEIKENFLIPSYFLKTIKHLYEKGGSNNYKEVVAFADRILLNEDYLHENIVNHVRFSKCQALARLRDHEFFGEVKKIHEPEKSFLHGFFYRMSGNQEKSINSYIQVLEKKPNDYRVKNELVCVYMQSHEYELAHDLAKEVYNKNPNAPISANNYLSCLFHKDEVDRELVEKIINKLKSNPSERVQEMYCSAKARFFAQYDNNIDGAYDIIEKTIAKYPDVSYPILTLADLSTQYKNIRKLKFAIDELDKIESKNSQTYRTYIRYKAIYLAMNGQYKDAIILAKKELKGVRESAIISFCEKLKTISKNSSNKTVFKHKIDN
ncbi:hypothetical protein QUF50_06230 [Thiotrichales bacterium HSG1]|nr:hypothetical protein [Thiotrichales bacterium HSG1]